MVAPPDEAAAANAAILNFHGGAYVAGSATRPLAVRSHQSKTENDTKRRSCIVCLTLLLAKHEHNDVEDGGTPPKKAE